MIYLTETIDSSRTPLKIGKINDNGSVLAVNKTGQLLHVERYWIKTPVLHCSECGKPVLLRINKVGKESAECPDNARHQFDKYMAISDDVSKYNRAARRKAYKIASQWLTKWRHQVKVKTKKLGSK